MMHGKRDWTAEKGGWAQEWVVRVERSLGADKGDV
jgi:hypothetical protein